MCNQIKSTSKMGHNKLSHKMGLFPDVTKIQGSGIEF